MLTPPRAALAAALALALAAPAHADEAAELHALRAASPAARVVDDAGARTLSRLRAPTTGPTTAARARAFLDGHRAATRTEGLTLVVTGTTESAAVSVARFASLHDGLVVDGDEVAVSIDAHGRVTRVVARATPVTAVLPAVISDDDAARIAVRAVYPGSDALPPHDVVIARRADGTAVRAVKVVVAKPASFDARAILVDTASGEILKSTPATVQ